MFSRKNKSPVEQLQSKTHCLDGTQSVWKLTLSIKYESDIHENLPYFSKQASASFSRAVKSSYQ